MANNCMTNLDRMCKEWDDGQTGWKAMGRRMENIETNGQSEIISPIDQVVLAVGMKPLDELKQTLEAKNIPYSVVGDGKQVRRILDAVEEGAKAAWNI